MDQLPNPIPSEHAQDSGAFMHPEEIDRDLFGQAPKHHRDWSHRRGEPRVFTLLWMIYLMGATMLMFSSMARAYSISPEITRPAARSMLVVVVVGFSVLWPMVRLSQRYPSHLSIRFTIRDIVVLYIPMQAVIWPQSMSMLAGWPIEVVAAISAFSLAWLGILAGVIALGSASIARNSGREWVRVAWMMMVMVIIFAAPSLGGLTTNGAGIDVDAPRVGWLLSPVTGVLEIVRPRDALGTSARVFGDQWRMIIALFFVGAALLLITRALEVARSRYEA